MMPEKTNMQLRSQAVQHWQDCRCQRDRFLDGPPSKGISLGPFWGTQRLVLLPCEALFAWNLWKSFCSCVSPEREPAIICRSTERAQLPQTTYHRSLLLVLFGAMMRRSCEMENLPTSKVSHLVQTQPASP